MNMDKSRAEFEAWASQRAQGHSVTYCVNGEYADYATQCAWQGWQAARRSAPVVAAPVAHVVDFDRSTNESIINAALEPGTAVYLAATVSAAPAAPVEFDQAKLMQLVREFAEVVYGVRRTTEDVGGKLIEYVKSLAATTARAGEQVDERARFDTLYKEHVDRSATFGKLQVAWETKIGKFYRAAMSQPKDTTKEKDA